MQPLTCGELEAAEGSVGQGGLLRMIDEVTHGKADTLRARRLEAFKGARAAGGAAYCLVFQRIGCYPS